MRISEVVVMISMIIVVCCVGFFFYQTHEKFISLEEYLIDLERKVEQRPAHESSTASVSHANFDISSLDLQSTATSSQLWLKIQQVLQNTVVQLKVTLAEHNVMQPYQVPKPGQSAGSGFIINEEGEIITNAHVVNQSTLIMAQMPAFGKHQFEIDLVGIMPEKDIALLKFKAQDLEMIKQKIGKLSFLQLGDSDTIKRSQEIMTLGYPLGQESLKSTTGVISGHESGMIQMSAPINPGNSGGPSIDAQGKVIGINTAGIPGAQNVGYIIPINDLKTFLKDLRAGGLVRKPYIGVYQSKVTTPELVKALGNPEPGGTYVVEVLYDSPLKDKLLPGDMIYKINDIPVDLYGEMSVPWSEDKVSTGEYISRIPVGQKVSIVAYRKGQKKRFVCAFDRKKLSPVRQMYPGYEELPYEAFGGYVVMPLMLNHLPHLLQVSPSLVKYTEEKNQDKPVLVVTNVIPNSVAHKTRMSLVGSTLKSVNGHTVKTLDDLKKAIEDSGDQITVKTNDNIVVALSKDKVVKQERSLSQMFGYPISSGMRGLLDKESSKRLL